jgi:hypothetical protein
MSKFDWAFLLFLLGIIMFQIWAGVTLYNQGKALADDDYILEMNLKTCANLLDNGHLSHQSQQSTCAELIRRALP